jgi:WD40 repeat protein
VASRSWDGTTKLWDEETGRVKFTKTTALKGASALAFSPDGATLATVDDRMNAVLLDVETFSERRRFPHPNFVGGLKFSPDGRTLATGSDQLRLWDASTGRLVRGQPPGGNIVYSHDGATIAMCGVRIHLRDAETGEVRHTLIGHSDGIVSLAFTPDDRMLASGSHGGRVKFWDMRTFQELATFSVGDYEVCDLSFSTDGKTLIAACTSDNGGQLVEWSFEEREHENGQRSPPDAE